MLETRKDIDAVIVATPDHVHAAVTMMALKMGKHVHCQKPLTHSVYEARMIGQAAAEAKVGTQMGNFGQASEEARLICETIWSGALGTVREVHAGSNRIPMISQRGCARPSDRPPVPAWLDWDLWVGPAPMRPYHPCYHPFSWRGWWDFGTGCLGDIGCHQFSAAFKALKLGHPDSVEAQLVEPSLWTGSGQRDRAAGLDHPMALPGRRRPRGGHAHLVGRRAEAASARGTGARSPLRRRATG